MAAKRLIKDAVFLAGVDKPVGQVEQVAVVADGRHDLHADGHGALGRTRRRFARTDRKRDCRHASNVRTLDGKTKKK